MIQFVPIFLCIGAGAWLRRRDVLPGEAARGIDARVLYVALLLGLRGPVTQVAVFEASIAPMITAGIMAAEYKLGRRVANLMVGGYCAFVCHHGAVVEGAEVFRIGGLVGK